MKKIGLFFLLSCVSLSQLSAQFGNDWQAYSAIFFPSSFLGNEILNCKVINNKLFISQSSGIAVYDLTTGAQELYHIAKTGEPLVYNGFGTGVSDIEQSPDGKIWALSAAAMLEYEGDGWRYVAIPDSVINEPIPNGTPFPAGTGFNDIYFESNTVFWIAALNLLWKYDGQNWVHYDYTDYGIDPVMQITMDQNGVLWATSFSGELASFDGTSWTQYVLSSFGIPNPIFYELSNPFVDQNNVKWFGLSCSLNSGTACQDSLVFLTYDDTTWNFIGQGAIGSNFTGITQIRGDGGILWAMDYEDGFLKYDGTTWTDYPIEAVRFDYNSTSGAIWGHGVQQGFSFDGVDTNHFNIGMHSLNGIETVFEKRGISAISSNQIYWYNIGLIGNINSTTQKVETIDTLSYFANPAMNKAFYSSIIAENDTNIWLAKTRSFNLPDSAGLIHYNGTTFDFFPVDTQLAPYDELIYDMAKFNNTIWLATENAGLLQWNGGNWTGNYPSPLNSSLELVITTNTGGLWLSEANTLIFYDGTTPVTYTSSNSNLPNSAIKDLYYDDANSTLWIATDTSGLVKYDGTTWTIYNTTNSAIASNRLTKVAMDGQGFVWVGTQDSGLVAYDGSSNWYGVTIDNNIPELDNQVYAIEIDTADNVWYIKGDQLFLFKGDATTVQVNEYGMASLLQDSRLYPNPFSQSTTFEYTLEQPAAVSLHIYDLQGRLLSSPVVEQLQAAGPQRLPWQPNSQLANGLYIYALLIDGNVAKTGKVVYQK